MVTLAQVDVSDEKQVQNLVAKAVGWAGGLDIWVNNAAKFVFGAASTATDAGKSDMHCQYVSELTSDSRLETPEILRCSWA